MKWYNEEEKVRRRDWMWRRDEAFATTWHKSESTEPPGCSWPRQRGRFFLTTPNKLDAVNLGRDDDGVVLGQLRHALGPKVKVAIMLVAVAVLSAESVVTLAAESKQADLAPTAPAAAMVLL